MRRSSARSAAGPIRPRPPWSGERPRAPLPELRRPSVTAAVYRLSSFKPPGNIGNGDGDQIISMHYFMAQVSGQVGQRFADDAGQIDRIVADKTARHRNPVRTNQVHDVTGFEVAHRTDDSGRQQRLTTVEDGRDRPGVEQQRTGTGGGVPQPEQPCTGTAY